MSAGMEKYIFVICCIVLILVVAVIAGITLVLISLPFWSISSLRWGAFGIGIFLAIFVVPLLYYVVAQILKGEA